MYLAAGLKEYIININRHRLYFRCKYNPSSNDVVLFIHGLACSSDTFRNVFDKEYFPDKSILVIDLPGFGKSSKNDNFSYSMQEQAKIIEELLSVLPEWNIDIVAHSMGGAIALLFSSIIFSRVLSFANVEGNLIGEDCGIMSRGIISVPFEEYKDNLYQQQIIEFKDHHQLRFEDSSPIALYKSAVSLVKWSESNELLKIFQNLKIKKCYFYGELNKEMPVLEKLSFTNKYMIHNCGHDMTTENPKEFYTKLVDFIYSK